MANFTGFNPAGAQLDIDNLVTLLKTTYNSLESAFNVMEIDLREYWTSPNAVEFAKTYVPKLQDLKSTFTMNGNIMIDKTVQAVNRMATANGSSFSVQVDELQFIQKEAHFYEEKDGIVGMNIQKVINLISGDFQEKLGEFYKNCEELKNLDIALYDPEGAIKESYKATLSNFENEVNETVRSMYTVLANAVNTEVDTVDNAKMFATEIISN